MKLKSYLKKNQDLIRNFDELYIHANKLLSDKNINRVARCCWDLKLSKEELDSEIIGVPFAHISMLPFHHGIPVLNIVIKKEEE